jgi:hypothetical protein
MAQSVFELIMENREHINEHGCLPHEREEKNSLENFKTPRPRQPERNRGLKRRAPSSGSRR